MNEWVLGTKGQASILDGRRIFDGNGREVWRYEGPQPNMWQEEHNHLFAALREGHTINNGPYMCNSTMLAVMGRRAGYTGEALDWDTCFHNNERLGPGEYGWTAVEEDPIAMPGRTKHLPPATVPRESEADS